MPPVTKSPIGPGYYIFITNSVEYEPFTTGDSITKVLAAHKFWLASRFTPYRKYYKIGDRVIFYVAGKGARHFVGDAEIAGPTEEASEKEIAFAEKLGLDGFAEKIPLRKVTIWKEPIEIKALINDLTFIKDKHNYGLHLRQAAARITEEDFSRIVSNRGTATKTSFSGHNIAE